MLLCKYNTLLILLLLLSAFAVCIDADCNAPFEELNPDCYETVEFYKYGDDDANTDKELIVRIAVVCGLHPRELISAKLCARWSAMLRTRVPPRPGISIMLAAIVHRGAAADTANGFGDPCWRGNEHGVDLNRNWMPVPECYAELLPLHNNTLASEQQQREAEAQRETIALNNLLREWMPHVLLAIHSGTRAVLTPYDSCDRTPDNWPDMLRFARWLTSEACPDCTISASPRALDYWAHGTLTDYATYWLEVPLALTLEIYEDRRAIHELHLRSLAAETQQRDSESLLTPELCATLFTPPDEVRMEHALAEWDSVLRRLALIGDDDLAELIRMTYGYGLL